jgi:hypothetical protein
MCAANNSPLVESNSFKKNTSESSTFRYQNRSTSFPSKSKPSHVGKQNNTPKQSGSAQKPGESRNAKRARWAKRSRPVAKPVVHRGPEKEYLCECHNEPARKTRAGTKETVKDHDSGKMKETPKGLGKWKCATTGKTTKVTPRKPQPKVVTVDMSAVEQRVVAELSTNATHSSN